MEPEEEITEINPVSNTTPNILNILTDAINSGAISVIKETPAIEVPLCSKDENETYDSFVNLSRDERMVFGELLKNKKVAYISNDKICFPDSITYEEFISFTDQTYEAIVIDRWPLEPDTINGVICKSSFIIARVIMEKSYLPFNNASKLPPDFGETLKTKGGFTPPNFVIYPKYNMELWIWSARTTPDIHATLLDANSYTMSVQQAKKAQLMAIQQSGLPFRFRGDFGSIPENDEQTIYTYTSGTTGDPVKVPHVAESKFLFNVSGIRELLWRGWVPTEKIVVCLSMVQVDRIDGNIYYKTYRGANDMQSSLEEIKPVYLFTYPSIVEDLDLSRIPSLKDIKTRGEVGSTCYYAEETGIIALKCPDNPENYHVMEHIVIEQHPDTYTGIAVTDLTNPYVKRYLLDDHAELLPKVCQCGRKTEVIKNVVGRTRNMLVNIEGDKIFPKFGNYMNLLPRFQIIQVSTTEFEFRKKAEFNYYQYKSLIDSLQLDLKNLCGAREIKFTIITIEEFQRPFEVFISYVK